MESVGNQNLPVVEAKLEYTRNLKSILQEPIILKFTEIYNKAKNSENKKVLIEYQRLLKEVLGWAPAYVELECQKICKTCSWLNDLLAAVIVTNVKILTSVKLGKTKKKIQIKMPSLDKFIHKVYIECAEAIYNNPYVISKNMKKDLIEIVNSAVDNNIRKSLPIQNILQMYIGEALNEESQEVEDADDEDDAENDVEDDAENDVEDDIEDDVEDTPVASDFPIPNNEEAGETKIEDTGVSESALKTICDQGTDTAKDHEQVKSSFFDEPLDEEEPQVKNVNIDQNKKDCFFDDAVDP